MFSKKDGGLQNGKIERKENNWFYKDISVKGENKVLIDRKDGDRIFQGIIKDKFPEEKQGEAEWNEGLVNEVWNDTNKMKSKKMIEPDKLPAEAVPDLEYLALVSNTTILALPFSL